MLFGAALIGGTRASRQFEPLAELLIRPEVASFGQLDFAELPALVEIGYEAAVRTLENFDGLDALRGG